jgi:hypothetical protein
MGGRFAPCDDKGVGCHPERPRCEAIPRQQSVERYQCFILTTREIVKSRFSQELRRFAPRDDEGQRSSLAS